MFTKAEIKKNLIGGLEIMLLMPTARRWFGNSREEAVRSFTIPILLMPVTIMMIYLQPELLALKAALHSFALVYCLRLAVVSGLFLVSVYALLKRLGRTENFNQFVIAINWLGIPAGLVFMPIMAMVATGGYSWQEVYPLALCAVVYVYIITGFLATCILRLPWEMGGFIAFIAFIIDNSADSIFQALNSAL
jgi:hypothetical protein